MEDWANYYFNMGFAIIPLAKGTKVPVAKGWDSKMFYPNQFYNRNIGTRVGENVCINGKTGRFFVLDFDAADLAILKQLCKEYDLPKTTCVRTGGNHYGYHLMYLTDFEVRKHSGLSYQGCSIDFMGEKSYIVLPPSVVDRPYEYRIPLEKIAFLEQVVYERMLTEFRIWQKVTKTIQKSQQAENDLPSILEKVKAIENVSNAMLAYAEGELNN